jgi:hypothetical protein
MRAKTLLILSATLAFLLLTISCSSGPAAPEKGTPAFYWSAANETFAVGDYSKTLEHLDNLLKTDNQYTARAYPWYLVLSTGMTHGYIELADRFETGARVNKDTPGAFRRQVSNYRGLARGLTLPFVETFDRFQKNNKDAEIPLAFPYPSGSQGEPITVSRVAGGILPPPAELETAQSAELKRTVLLATARATGSGDDTAKAQSLFKAGPVKVPRTVFQRAMANALYDHAMLFEQKKMDEPNRMKLMLTRAAGALKSVPENKAVKELSTKIDKAQKTLKKT